MVDRREASPPYKDAVYMFPQRFAHSHRREYVALESGIREADERLLECLVGERCLVGHVEEGRRGSRQS